MREPTVKRLMMAIEFAAMLLDSNGGGMNGVGFEKRGKYNWICHAFVDGIGMLEGQGQTPAEALIDSASQCWRME